MLSLLSPGFGTLGFVQARLLSLIALDAHKALYSHTVL